MDGSYRIPLVTGLLICLLGGIYLGFASDASQRDIVIIMLISEVFFLYSARKRHVVVMHILVSSIALLFIGYTLLISTAFILFFGGFGRFR